METEAIDRLFLELSQFTKAKTKREIELAQTKDAAMRVAEGLIVILEETFALLTESQASELNAKVSKLAVTLHPNREKRGE